MFDRNLSNGFSEGDKDKDTVISTINSFRENKLTPLYNLTDYYVMLKAWDSAFIDDMRYQYSEYQDKTDSEIFRSWAENFKFQYGNLFPEPESITQDNNAKKLDNLLKAQQLGANPADLQEELNESEIFKNEMELDSQGGMEGEEENDLFDYTQNEAVQNDSSIKADSDNYFKEEDHERDKDGKFTKKGSGEDNKQENKKETNNEDSSEEKQKEEKEIKEKIEQLEKIDWTKDNTLPNFLKSLLKEYGFQDKPILLKFNVIDRNFNERHKDVDKEKAIKILGNALYKTDEIFYGRVDRPNYYNFIHYTDDGHSDLVLVEIEEKKENYEIVHFYSMNKRGQRKLEKQTDKLEKKS